MKTIRLRFDPLKITKDSECWPAFQAGGMTLKFWALYKNEHITNQYFRPALERLAQYFSEAFDEEITDVMPYANIDEFIWVIRRCGFHVDPYGNFNKWALKNWSFFSLSIQEQVQLEYEAVEPVVKTYAA